jgi:predicted RNA methylase
MIAALDLPAPVSVVLHLLRCDGGTQARAAMCQATIEAYQELLDALPPVTVFRDPDGVFWLVDGFHRVEAARRAGRDMLVGHVYEGTLREAVLHAVGANAEHGLPRTRADKQRAVERLLDDAEWSTWSDRAIARAARVTHPFVAAVRARHVAPAGELTTDTSAPADQAPAGGNVSSDDTFQAPEPDNTVRTPVVPEHKGKALTAGDHDAMRALSGMGREWLAERFRVDAAEVDRILDAPALAQEGPAPRAEALSQFFTPPWLAAKMVELADLRAGDTVLEPSGGRGALVRAILDAFPGADVVVHELDPRMAAELRTIEGDVEVIEGSYLDVNEGSAAYPAAVMNPPYENGLDGLFLAKACAEACTVVALVRANIFYGSTRFRSVWAKYGKHLTAVRHVVARPDFTEGTPGVHGAMSDFVVIRLDDLDYASEYGLARPTVDWWLEPEGGET